MARERLFGKEKSRVTSIRLPEDSKKRAWFRLHIKKLIEKLIDKYPNHYDIKLVPQEETLKKVGEMVLEKKRPRLEEKEERETEDDALQDLKNFVKEMEENFKEE